MTSITRNLPWFIREPSTWIIGEKCYVSLIQDLNLFNDVDCLKYAFSKALGIGLVIGGSVMKLPQLILILRAHSARGLSLTSFSLETLAYGINLVYNYRNEFPFSTYGENFFLTIQNILITFLIIIYTHPLRSKPKPKPNQVTVTNAAITLLLISLTLIYTPMPFISFLQLLTLPISLFSKLPQIRQNYRSKSTGQLSAFAVGAQVAGCIARLFTTAVEVGDWLVSAGFLLAAVLNAVLGLQLWLYWGSDGLEGSGYKAYGMQMQMMKKAERMV